MKRFCSVVVLFLLVAVTARASHIVGGEFEMVFKRIDANGNHRYNISLILYFDVINGQPGARDPFVQARIFRKRDNRIMISSILLNSYTTKKVEYFQPDCSSDDFIVTDRIYYSYMEGASQGEYALSPDMFNDPGGYYISWERCCRNYNITNAYSQDPNFAGGIYAGQTFYLQFPALVKDGEPFINSSPRLFAPLSDYACPNRLYYVDFGGTDIDDDSLVYSMVTPYNTWSGDALPPGDNLPRPGPYPDINWKPPFTDFNFMDGNPDLNISTDGMLTVVPTRTGLFVFAVKCEEYRNGKKIGELRRDFQLLVLSECPLADAPIVEAKPLGGSFQKGSLSVSFSNTATDDSRCIVVRVKDPSSERIENGNQDSVEIRAVAIGFKDKTVKDIIPEISKAKLVNGSTAEFVVCFPKCPYHLGPYKIGIIAQDNSCPLPLLDTIVVTVNVELPPNEEPYFVDKEIIQTVSEGSGIVSWNIVGLDEDHDPLVLMPVAPIGYSLTDYGFTYAQTLNQNGRVEAVINWNSQCDVIDFSQRTNFPFSFLLNDLDECNLLPPDTMRFDLTMDLYDFHWPVIEYVPDPTLEKVELETKIYEQLEFNVRGTDADNEVIVLYGEGTTFSMSDVGASFPTVTANGEVESLFSWKPDCDKVNLGNYNYRFIVTNDDNRCNYHLADTLQVRIKVVKPDNTPPVLTADGVADELNVTYTLGDPIAIPLVGVDADTNPLDLLTLTMDLPDGETLPEGFVFEPQQGYGTVEGLLTWNPGCEIFNTPDYENKFNFVFRVMDDRCYNSNDNDLIAVNMTIKDKDKEDKEFLPPNFISPNGDAWNSFFAMVKRDDEGNLVSILPKDNCAGVFISISVYNRWGNQVFESTDREFKWHPIDVSTGVYFYTLTYSNTVYRGSVSVAKGE